MKLCCLLYPFLVQLQAMNIEVCPRLIRAWILLGAIFAFTSSGSAQDSNGAQLVVAPTAMNFLYRGLDNPVHVAVPGISCADLKISTSSGRITGEGCDYVIVPGKESVLEVYAHWHIKGKVDSSYVIFRVKAIPPPNPYFAGMSVEDDSLSVSAARVAQGVVARVEGLGFDLRVQIIGYRLILSRGCTVLFDGTSNEARATEAMFTALGAAQVGDNLVIKEIRAKWPDGNISQLEKLEFVLY